MANERWFPAKQEVPDGSRLGRLLHSDFRLADLPTGQGKLDTDRAERSRGPVGRI